MNAVTNYLSEAELALASYAALPVGISASDTERALRLAGMATDQAIRFASTYTVVTQFNDTLAEGGTGTSFSATVFKDASGNLTLALRGTAELTGTPNDISTDTNIALDGAGYDQIVAMYNWWQRASTTAGTQVTQYAIQSFASSGVPPLPANATPLYVDRLAPNVLWCLVPVDTVAANTEWQVAA